MRRLTGRDRVAHGPSSADGERFPQRNDVGIGVRPVERVEGRKHNLETNGLELPSGLLPVSRLDVADTDERLPAGRREVQKARVPM